jgi:hypothetical protein
MDIDTSDELSDNEKVRNYNILYETHSTVQYFIDNHIKPDVEWFVGEYKNVLKYTVINWNQITVEYKWKDPYLCDIIYDIKKALISIIDEYSCKDHFSLQQYFFLLKNIIMAWEHYSKYNSDDGLAGLLESLTL